MRKDELAEVILRSGEFTLKEISEMIGMPEDTIRKNVDRPIAKLSSHCKAHREGSGKNSIYKLDDVPTEPIPKKEFGKDPNKVRKERNDKGMQREDYITIKEEFKPLIYNVLLNKPGFSHTDTFSNWLLESQLVEHEFIKERRRVVDEYLNDDFIKDFITAESDSLRRCFISALEDMKDKGEISWNKKKNAVNIDGEHLTLDDKESAEIDKIEKELCKTFEVSSRNELMYTSRKKLREFDAMFSEILTDRYDYTGVYTVHQVVAEVGVNKENIDKNIEEAKQKYGIIKDTQKVITSCKNNIYKSRLKRAKIRYEARVQKINSKYDEDKKSELCADEFAELLRESELGKYGSFENYINHWINCYRKNIYKGI